MKCIPILGRTFKSLFLYDAKMFENYYINLDLFPDVS